MNSSQVSYSTRDIVRLVPVSARQLQWWDERLIVRAPRFKNRKAYRPEDLFGILLLRELKERGFNLRQARKVWRAVESRQGDENQWLLTNGERAVFLGHPDVVLAFLEQRRNPAFVLISLAAIQRQVEAAPSKVRKSLPVRKAPGAVRFEDSGARRDIPA